MDDAGPALQDALKVQCFGCGTLNEHGLQIKSRWQGDELVCRWQPPPHYIGHPGVVYGGAIASVVDCHAVWTAMAAHCRDHGIALGAGASPPAFVTGRLNVDYLRPADIEQPLELRAHVVEHSGRRSTVTCRVLQGDVECATAEVVVVRLKEA
ncbi:PaaI family thioesterase [Roseateles sp. NT4]|uniref:PaaI family thioesterase n=1 Tax=Roseateles sp. NT4 TaxID=3453715 RepID=UPI003EEF580A